MTDPADPGRASRRALVLVDRVGSVGLLVIAGGIAVAASRLAHFLVLVCDFGCEVPFSDLGYGLAACGPAVVLMSALPFAVLRTLRCRPMWPAALWALLHTATAAAAGAALVLASQR